MGSPGHKGWCVIKPHDTLLTALTSLASNKLRAGLTLLGIIIGVVAVIVLMAMGRGVQQSITASIESLGSNLLIVTPGSPESDSGGFGFFRAARGGRGDTLTMEDAYALVDPVYAPSVAAVAPQKSTGGSVAARGNDTFADFVGVTPEYASVRNVKVETGAFISHGHVLNNSNVAVLGASISEALFGIRDPIGEAVRMNGKQFTVIGVLESQGFGFFGIADQQVIVPLTTLNYRLSSEPTTDGGVQVDSINVQVVNSQVTERATDEITTVLRLRHRLTEESDFTINDQQETLQAVQEATNALVVFLGVIAGISLMVGGIGIMNIMLVSVTERTREIGVRKAMGAKRRDILLQFVAEASLLSLGGGLVGLAIGFGISALINGSRVFGEDSDPLTMAVTGDIVALALGVSVIIGLFFGIYPALRAARLHPIDALRYE